MHISKEISRAAKQPNTSKGQPGAVQSKPAESHRSRPIARVAENDAEYGEGFTSRQHTPEGATVHTDERIEPTTQTM
ncbi:hypothetical protein JTB14_033157 [Gonioctena quinquepunctata]|nr:hypothetical protein JTB14_033157 [Gonioctena quinquepunctata]